MRDIERLHHVGHVVRDIAAAIALYRRMGFALPLATFPALPPAPGEPARAFGAGNTHVTLGRNFVELVAIADDPPESSTLVPLDAPPAALKRLTAGIAATAARLSAALERFEGLHVLAFQTPDADGAAARLTADGVPHGGVQRLRRPAAHGGDPVQIGYLELEPEAQEGRLALAEDLAGDEPAEHPNGALDLVESFLCVPDAELAEHGRRYARYIGHPADGTGAVRTFDLGGGRVTLIAASGLNGVLPGEQPPALPAFVGYVVTVRRLGTVRRLVTAAGLPLRDAPGGEVFVPAAAALGAAVVFRQAS